MSLSKDHVSENSLVEIPIKLKVSYLLAKEEGHSIPAGHEKLSELARGFSR